MPNQRHFKASSWPAFLLKILEPLDWAVSQASKYNVLSKEVASGLWLFYDYQRWV